MRADLQQLLNVTTPVSGATVDADLVRRALETKPDVTAEIGAHHRYHDWKGALPDIQTALLNDVVAEAARYPKPIAESLCAMCAVALSELAAAYELERDDFADISNLVVGAGIHVAPYGQKLRDSHAHYDGLCVQERRQPPQVWLKHFVTMGFPNGLVAYDAAEMPMDRVFFEEGYVPAPESMTRFLPGIWNRCSGVTGHSAPPMPRDREEAWRMGVQDGVPEDLLDLSLREEHMIRLHAKASFAHTHTRVSYAPREGMKLGDGILPQTAKLILART